MDLNVIPEKIDIYNFDCSNDIDIWKKESDNFLNNMNFVDCFRFLNKGKISYSWFGNFWNKKNIKDVDGFLFLLIKIILLKLIKVIF